MGVTTDSTTPTTKGFLICRLGAYFFISSNESQSRNQPHKGSSSIYSEGSLMVFVSHKTRLDNMQFGSGLEVIVALNNIADKIHIYGWDNYLDSDIRDISIIQYISYLMSVPKSPYYRRLKLIVEKVINLVYAYRIASYKKITIYSNLSGIRIRKEFYFKYKSFIYK